MTRLTPPRLKGGDELVSRNSCLPEHARKRSHLYLTMARYNTTGRPPPHHDMTATLTHDFKAESL